LAQGEEQAEDGAAVAPPEPPPAVIGTAYDLKV